MEKVLGVFLALTIGTLLIPAPSLASNIPYEKGNFKLTSSGWSQTNDKAPAEWTFMVYLDADNNLESPGIDDFLEMASVGSTSDVKILVQMDRIERYDSTYDDWTGCKRYLVTQGMTPTIANAIQDLGEANMGDPNTLANFLIWAIQNYPSNRYAVVLWDHGSGWKSFGNTKSVCIDDTNGDYLTIAELEQAFATVESTTGVEVDMVGFDACLMGMIEIAYEIRNRADIMVASQEVEPEDGWPYDDILANLTSNPMMTQSELAAKIVTEYMTAYTESWVTQSAANIDVSTYATINELATATSNFAQKLRAGVSTYRSEITQARQQVDETEGDSTYIDLYHFAQLIYTLIPDPDIQNAAEQVMDTLTDNLIAEGHNLWHQSFHGLSIYFPEDAGEYISLYEDLTFAKYTEWDEFLNQYYICSLTIIASSGGTTDPAPGTRTYMFGSSVQVTAIPDMHYMFDHWELDGVPIGSANPYVVLMNDNHVLHAVFAIHDVAVTNIALSKTLVVQGGLVYINVTVANQGDYAENFNVTVYYDTTAIETKNVVYLFPSEETTLTFMWNTTGIKEGDYTLSAEASVVPDETKTADNTKAGDVVTVLSPWHDITVTEVTPSKTVLGQNYSLFVYVTVKNYGNFTENFNVTAYYNANAISYATVIDLSPGEEVILTFTWNTTGLAEANYTISAYAVPVPNETDTADNMFTDGLVVIAMLGDITGPESWPDGKVDILDVASVAICFGYNQGDLRYEPNCDIDGDGKIDIIDVATVAMHFGETEL